MVRWILAVLTVLLFSVAGIVVLALLLWWLLRRQKAEQAAPQIEIDEEPTAVDTGPRVVDEEAAPPALDVEVPEIEVAEEEPVVVVPPPDAEADEPAPGAEVMADALPQEVEPPAADDLEVIAGIGPKISKVLQEAGITTFAALATTEASHLEEVLEAESPRLLQLADPATWPEQARFAASGDWEGFEAFQATLKGGRIE